MIQSVLAQEQAITQDTKNRHLVHTWQDSECSRVGRQSTTTLQLPFRSLSPASCVCRACLEPASYKRQQVGTKSLDFLQGLRKNSATKKLFDTSSQEDLKLSFSCHRVKLGTVSFRTGFVLVLFVVFRQHPLGHVREELKN